MSFFNRLCLLKYADPVMDIIDKNNVCSLRLFRENCTLYNGVFVKDLSLMNRDLKDLIIIDVILMFFSVYPIIFKKDCNLTFQCLLKNSETSFLFQPANAVHIKSFFDDMKDRELYRLIPMLIFLSNVKIQISYVDFACTFKRENTSQLTKLFFNILELRRPSCRELVVGV